FLFACPPEELDLRYEGVKRNVPPPARSISLMPAGSPGWVRSSGCKEELHIFLEPRLVGRVAAEAFGLDPAQLTLPPLDGLHLPQRRVAGQRPGRPPDPQRLRPLPPGSSVGQCAPAGEAPRRGRVRRGTPRWQPDPGADGGDRPPQRLPLRAAVQGGHRAAAAPVRHYAPR